MQQKQLEYDSLREDYSNISGELQSEKRRKTEVEGNIRVEKERHRNEVTLIKQESDWYLQRLAQRYNTFYTVN